MGAPIALEDPSLPAPLRASEREVAVTGVVVSPDKRSAQGAGFGGLRSVPWARYPGLSAHNPMHLGAFEILPNGSKPWQPWPFEPLLYLHPCAG